MRINRYTNGSTCRYECLDVYGCSVVGSAVVKIRADHVYLQDINIASPYRGQGIGSALLKHILSDHDLPVVADVFEERVAWYKRNGFKKVGRVQNLIRMRRDPSRL